MDVTVTPWTGPEPPSEQAIQERFLVAGARVLSSTPEGAIAFAAKERTMWKDVVAASGAKVD